MQHTTIIDMNEDYHVPKLKMQLKSPASEKAERALRKEQKRLRKERKKVYEANGLGLTPPRTVDREESLTPPRKKRKLSPTTEEARGWDDDFDESTRVPPASAHKAPDIHDEAAWREKLFDLMEDEEGPNDLVSGRYVSPPPPPIPKRWQTTHDPTTAWDTLAEEDYAEAVRYGMWRRKNKEEAERMEKLEQWRKDEERRKTRKREADAKREEARMAKIAAMKAESEEQAKAKQVEAYRQTWQELKDATTELRFLDMPWPIYRSSNAATVFSIESITSDAVRTFLLDLDGDPRKVLREAILTYHPDRFVGRYLPRVRTSEQELVKSAVIRCSQIINDIASQHK